MTANTTEARIRAAAQEVGDLLARKTRLDTLIADLATSFGQPVIDPIDASAPPGTHRRRILAHNALMDLAVPGRDRYCGLNTRVGTPCVLREEHQPPRFDDLDPNHMDVEQRDRARRYLVHSEPDPTRRA